MAANGAGDGVGSVAELLAKTTVKQINEVSFAGKGLKLDKAEDGMIFANGKSF